MKYKTPEIIREVLGQEIYNLFEENAPEYMEERTLTIWTSSKGKELFEQAIKECYDKETRNSL